MRRAAGHGAGLVLAGLVAGLWAPPGPAQAQIQAQTQASAQVQVPDDAAERDRIGRERQAVQARFDQAQRDCAGRFQVNACLDGARAERRQALDRLHREQVVLDDARRRTRAAERLQGQQRRQREREAQAALAASAGAAAASAPALRPGSAASAPARARDAAAPAPSTSASASASATAARQVARAAAHQRRKQQAARHAEAVRQRNAEQDARQPPAAGLPIPGGSAPAPR
ncbi:hypothetical protein [Aquabacterium sp. OR-4]|uniref:hypothetical protein n=1 Tax=Aquabacterium sp. OR-4 TaxID=2978127 RepID=UPI0021B1E1D1|nr:hypothetical protein [Aquabacterium sp. OR-4]MDT7835491.1 hypothetical protein [Aquabacterium sp. OR-4]